MELNDKLVIRINNEVKDRLTIRASIRGLRLSSYIRMLLTESTNDAQ